MPQFAKVLSRDVGAFSNQAGARRSARPGVRLAQTGSGTSSLCEMKPDPIARADASPTRPYPAWLVHPSGAPKSPPESVSVDANWARSN